MTQATIYFQASVFCISEDLSPAGLAINRNIGRKEMTALNLTDGNITHRKEIIQLFQMAIAKEWQTSYLSVKKNHITSHPVKLSSVNAHEGTFRVDGELAESEQKEGKLMMFRAENGGLSVVFKSRMGKPSSDENVIRSRYEHQVDLPYEVRCTQLRKTVRVNLESLPEEVPVALYLSVGERIDGSVIDISTSGARFKVNRDLTEDLKNVQLLDFCRICFPDESFLQAEVQLMGISFDHEYDASILRCQFVDTSSKDEEMLQNFISYVQDQAEPIELTIAN